MIGKTIAHYEVVDRLGAGGMGVVFRARDTRLHRDVAIKALPQEFAEDPQRLGRFEQEARTLASLNHANIGAIYGLERSEGQSFLILELVSGETLADLLKRGPLTMETAVEVAAQAAQALAAAHDAGVVHRDVKPANIKLDAEGRVKVLDFGLAKVTEAESGVSSADSASPTEIDHATAVGTIMGTAPYMSPEQARGQRVDESTDVWAFGCLLYEMLTGRRAFDGATHSDTTAAILRGRPEWSRLPAPTPAPLRKLIEWCLVKEPKSRLRDLNDARLILESIEELGARSPAGENRASRRHRPWLLVLGTTALLAVGLLLGSFGSRLLAPEKPAGAFQIPMAPPEGLKPSLGFGPSVAISPDGRYLAYVLETGTTTTLYVKGPEDLEARPLAATQGARTPFFSPKSEWLGFFDERERKIKKISLGGGEPIAIADAHGSFGAAWASDDTILFAPTSGRIAAVSTAGGTPREITPSGTWPALIPGKDVVLYTIREGRGSFDEAAIAAVPVSGGEPKIILESAYYPHYAATGHLVFVQGDSVLAAPFDVGTLEITGPAVTVLERVWTSSWTGYADFAFSDSGTLLYVSGGPDAGRARVVKVDREGDSEPILTERRPYRVPRLSPDELSIAMTITDEQVDIWTHDLRRGNTSRLTDSASWDAYPQWQPHSDSIAFASMRDGLPAIYLRDLRRGTVERLFYSEFANFPSSWSSDGKLLAYDEDNPETGTDIWVYSVDSGSSSVFLATPHTEASAEFSPDGRYLAYESDETGQQSEIYIRPYPAGNPRLKISTDGGRFPRWSANGEELFYWVGGRVMAVALETDPELLPAAPRTLFEGPYGAAYDASGDGRTFLMLQEMSEDDPPMRINMVANWFERLERLAGRDN